MVAIVQVALARWNVSSAIYDYQLASFYGGTLIRRDDAVQKEGLQFSLEARSRDDCVHIHISLIV